MLIILFCVQTNSSVPVLWLLVQCVCVSERGTQPQLAKVPGWCEGGKRLCSRLNYMGGFPCSRQHNLLQIHLGSSFSLAANWILWLFVWKELASDGGREAPEMSASLGNTPLLTPLVVSLGMCL